MSENLEKSDAAGQEEIWSRAMKALAFARVKHPVWPSDPIHCASIVAEEAGELIQSTLQAEYEYQPYSKCETEAYHVIATAIRFLTHR